MLHNQAELGVNTLLFSLLALTDRCNFVFFPLHIWELWKLFLTSRTQVGGFFLSSHKIHNHALIDSHIYFIIHTYHDLQNQSHLSFLLRCYWLCSAQLLGLDCVFHSSFTQNWMFLISGRMCRLLYVYFFNLECLSLYFSFEPHKWEYDHINWCATSIFSCRM